MITALAHRGPDGQGFYFDDRVSLGHARLSIIDPKGGHQPIPNEDSTVWVVCNGEIFNYIELRQDLEKQGHRFSTECDIEVLVHLYEDYGDQLFQMLNGQFALVLWDRKRQKMFLARDHVGICPLYYHAGPETFVFASELKSLFQWPDIPIEWNERALVQTLTFWSPIPGHSMFKNIHEIKPGHYLQLSPDRIEERSYWDIPFTDDPDNLIRDPRLAREQTRELLQDAVRIRLRADVPVGAYLSGGLDSSIITSLIKTRHQNRIRTFSIGFENNHYDERYYQEMVSSHLGTDHSFTICTSQDIIRALDDVIWHAEKPILRTAPAPLFLLSQAVNQAGFKVVLTGEGADEFFTGYNIYKETKVRLFNARHPESSLRPLLFLKLYPYLDGKNDRTHTYWLDFFKHQIHDPLDPYYSHRLRWTNGNFMLNFLHPDLRHETHDYNPIDDLDDQISPLFFDLSPLNRAHHLESTLFLAGYLLSSQGDRMLMSHSVEGRYPFLDPRVIRHAARLSPELKLHVLNEKHILKETFSDLLPPPILQRNKQPYRAPVTESLLHDPDLLNSQLSPEKTTRQGLFDADRVHHLVKKAKRQHSALSAREEMSLMAVITMGMLFDQFVNIRTSRFTTKTGPIERYYDYRSVYEHQTV
jgi:asparagine synthase (glutamine-hydrolysing)